ncbi:MAG: T9SS type A sorting domain-containing protein [Bacteroidales bacterium]|nr:T9SS type A sorting domain-containing protein [Bacteroidales bacterium]
MEYDADGNRISRQVTTNCIEKREIAEVQETETYEDVDVYPNPNNGMFIIIMQDCVKQEAACYELFDVNGMMLLSGKLHENETEVDVGTVPVGVYLLRIKNGENVISKVIVIN